MIHNNESKPTIMMKSLITTNPNVKKDTATPRRKNRPSVKMDGGFTHHWHTVLGGRNPRRKNRPSVKMDGGFTHHWHTVLGGRNTGRTHTHLLTSFISDTLTFGNQIQVDFVGKSRTTEETTAPRRQSTRTRNGRKAAQMTAGM